MFPRARHGPSLAAVASALLLGTRKCDIHGTPTKKVLVEIDLPVGELTFEPAQRRKVRLQELSSTFRRERGDADRCSEEW